jgi:hypothetical protein
MLAGIITTGRRRPRRCRDCGYPIPPRGRCSECGVPVAPSIPSSLGKRSRRFCLTAFAAALTGIALIVLIADAWSAIPSGSMFSSPERLALGLLLVSVLFSGLGLLCQAQLVSCRHAMGVRHRRPWTDPLVPFLLVIPVLSITSITAVFTFTGHLPWRIAPQLIVIERFSLFMLIACQLAVAILVGRLLARIVGLLNSIDRDWWRNRVD